MLAKLPDTAQQTMLLQSLQDAEGADQEMQTMMDAWQTGDTGVLNKELQAEFGPYPDIYQAILVQRNTRMGAEAGDHGSPAGSNISWWWARCIWWARMASWHASRRMDIKSNSSET